MLAEWVGQEIGAGETTIYQFVLDGELLRATDQLRKQQDWRIRSGIETELV